MIINHNLASLNAWRNLQNTDKQMDLALQRLSSGLRINRAADDAAGLAISEKMRSQINGLTQAISNAQNGISLLQTAEGALSTSESILQRMRQLALQAAADSSNASDRQQMQKEMDQLAQEMSRISNTTEFNTKNLLGGAFQNQVFQIGANANQTVSVGINAMDAFSLGVTAKQGVTIADGNLFSSASLVGGATAKTDAYQVTGTVTTAAVADSGTASQVVTTAVYGVNWAADSITATMGTGATKGAAGNGYTFSFTDGAAGVTTTTATVSGTTVNVTIKNGGDSAANIAAAIQSQLRTATGDNTIAVTSTGATTTLTAAAITTNTQTTTGLDAASLSFTAATAGPASGVKVVLAASGTAGSGASVSVSGTTVTVNYNKAATVQDIVNAVANNSTAAGLVKVSAGSGTATTALWGTAATSNLTGGSNAQLTLNLLDSNGTTVQSGVAVTAGSSVNFSNGLSVTLAQSQANQLAANAAIATQTIDVVAASSAAAVTGNNGMLNSQATVTKGLLIDTQANAQAALTAIDSAINKVSTNRATLGALQNRLDNTVSNLGITNENMTAAESRIRDADMAQEMANFTREQILMQAGTAMLAQANQKPQSVLQLLKG